MSENVIEIDNLVVEYRGKRALDGLTLKVARGQVFGFLGPNGAGKSTAIKTLLGLVFARSGLVRVHGRDPSHPAARALIGYLPEEATYYRFLTPVEILHFYGTICGVPPKLLKSRIEDLLGQVGLWPVRNRQLGTFSKGMNQKVGLAQCLIHDPQTLILDEPTSGLDPLARLELRELWRRLARQGKTIFFSSHELSEAELLCDSIAILKDGRLVRSGSLGEVLEGRQDSLERFFLREIGGQL